VSTWCSRRVASFGAVPAFYGGEWAEPSGVVCRVADAASVGCYNGFARVLRLERVGAGSVEGADSGPRAVIADERTVSVYVKDWGEGVAG